MREIRTSGSEGGETGQPVFPTPISGRTERRRRGRFMGDDPARAASRGLKEPIGKDRRFPETPSLGGAGRLDEVVADQHQAQHQVDSP